MCLQGNRLGQISSSNLQDEAPTHTTITTNITATATTTASTTATTTATTTAAAAAVATTTTTTTTATTTAEGLRAFVKVSASALLRLMETKVWH